MADENTTDADGFDFKKWYGKHGKKLNKSRRERYAEDPEYRARVLKANRDSRKRRRKEQQSAKAEERGATKLKTRPRPWKVVEAEIETSTGTARNKLFTIGALARVLGCSVQAIRLWEKQGVIREPEVRNGKGDRLYSPNEIRVIHEVMQAQGRVSDSKVRQRSTPQGFERRVQFKEGKKKHVKLVRLFRIGVLAKALDRTVLTVEQMEQRGALPATPFRASSTGYRLYTFEMVEVAKKAMDARDGVIRGKKKWAAFYNEVYEGWTRLGVMNASLAD
jgi:DNA-binding transcriptional MerR regulator